MYLRVFFIVVVNIQKFIFIRLCNLYLLRNALKKIHGATTRNATGWVWARFFHIRTQPVGLLSKPEPNLINFQTFAVFALVVFFLLLFFNSEALVRKNPSEFHEKSRGITDNINLLQFFFSSCSPFSLALALFLFIFFFNFFQRLPS